MYHEIEMDTATLKIALAERELYDSTRDEKRQEWELLSGKDCGHAFTAAFISPKCCPKLFEKVL